MAIDRAVNWRWCFIHLLFLLNMPFSVQMNFHFKSSIFQSKWNTILGYFTRIRISLAWEITNWLWKMSKLNENDTDIVCVNFNITDLSPGWTIITQVRLPRGVTPSLYSVALVPLPINSAAWLAPHSRLSQFSLSCRERNRTSHYGEALVLKRNGKNTELEIDSVYIRF